MHRRMIELENELRQTAVFVQRTPSAALRQRTLRAVQDQASLDIQPAMRRTPLALAAFSLALAALAFFASPQSSTQPALNTHARREVKPVRTTVPASLPKFSVAPVQVALARPLKNEFELLARDAERAIERVRQEIARLPRPDAIHLHVEESEDTDVR